MTIVGEVRGEGCSADNDAAADFFNYDFVVSNNNRRQIARSDVRLLEVGAGFSLVVDARFLFCLSF